MRDEDVIDRLAKAREGEGPAAEAVLAWLMPRITRYVTARCRADPARADDVAQEAAWHVWNGLERCQAASPGQLVAWGLKVAQRALLDAERAAPPRTLRWVDLDELERTSPHGDEAIGDPTVQAAAEAAARAALRLPGATGYLLWARLVDGVTWVEAAERLGTTPAGAKRRFQRATARLAATVRAALITRLGRPPPDWLLPRGPPAGRGEAPGSCSDSCGD